MRKLFLLFFLPGFVCAQQSNEPRGQEGQFTFDTDRPFKLLTLDEKIDEPIATKKKKPKKKVFYGIKTKKGFARRGYGNKMTIELFYVLKKRDEKYNGFARDVFWYDYTRREVRKTSNAGFDPKRGVLLHGPYKKMMGDVTVEEGIFYKGAKHGRWMAYNTTDLVEDKSKFYKGWPKDSYVTYYDPNDRKHLKEVVPIEYGEKEGYYYMLFEDGTVAVRGEYMWNEKIGDWIENYPNGKRKRIIAYPEVPFKKDFTPYIRKEWDDKGKEIYSR